jgi:hypothetical protein
MEKKAGEVLAPHRLLKIFHKMKNVSHFHQKAWNVKAIIDEHEHVHWDKGHVEIPFEDLKLATVLALETYADSLDSQE